MADINVIGVAERDLHTTRSGNVKTAYLVERQIDLAKLADKKGAALADGDVVIAIKIPAQSVIQSAFVAVDEKISDATASVVVDTASGTSLVAAAAIGAADANTVVAASTPQEIFNNATDTVNVTLTGVAGATGSFRVSVEIMDLTQARRPGLAELGS